MDNSNLDKLFRDKLSNHESNPSPKAWEDLDKMLNQKKSKSRKRVFYMVAAAVLFIGVASVVFFQVPYNEEKPVIAQQVDDLNIPQNEISDENQTPHVESGDLVAENADNSPVPKNEKGDRNIESATNSLASESKKQFNIAENTKTINKKIRKQESIEQIEKIQTENLLADRKGPKNTENQIDEEILSDQSESVTITFGRVALKTTNSESPEEENLGEEQMWGDDSLLETLASDSKATNESKKILRTIKNTTSQLLAFNGKNKNLETE
ncbi:hypothetical protein OO013_13935 [Mangrovivirga sp. M17]|uniref:Uncharacterized protein n=1 Tax=Mangrovivirga halotolerans TaxID=2993936 RepID=A0ABT3RTQ8_9BACT|nr:hypothetical protein [Mangrovivirga halotolerans]MCX2744978.1 hypothetical protein [Mangrovivirga halotolerans]